MKFELKELKNHQVEITAEVEKKQFERAKQKAARSISKQSKIPGFRPGKAPYDVVKRIYGEEMIAERAVEDLVNIVYREAVEKSEIKPYGPGKLDDITENDPPKYKFIIPLEPVIKINEYKSVRQAYKLPKVTKKEIDEVIADLQTKYATAEDVDRAAKEGDLVTVKISAEIAKPEKDEKPEVLKETPHQVVLGEHAEEEQFPYKGFMKELVGLKKGVKKEFSHKYKKDSQYENLQNKMVNFQVSIQDVKQLNKPEVDEEFAKMLGVESVENLTQSITDQLETGKLNEYDNKYFDDLLEKLLKKSDVKYPPEMLENEIEDILKNFEQNIAQQNLDLDTYLKINNRKKEDFIDEDIKPAAVKRLEQALIIEEISRQENIEVNQEQLQTEYTVNFQIQSGPEFKTLQKKLTTKKLSEAIVMQSASRVLHRNTLERLKQIATGELEKAEENKVTEEKVESKNINKQKEADSDSSVQETEEKSANSD